MVLSTQSEKPLNVVYSEAEAETCETFNNGKMDIGMRPALIILDHEKPVTPLKKFHDKRFCKLRHEPKIFKNMGYEIALVKI